MDKLPNLIHKAIAAVCPIDGISIDDINNKSSWMVNAPTATQAQITAAQGVINTFDLAAARQAEINKASRAVVVETEASGDVFIDRLRNATPDQIKTFVTNNVTDLASAKILIARMAIAIAYLLRND
jgi:hypothetical protein